MARLKYFNNETNQWEYVSSSGSSVDYAESDPTVPAWAKAPTKPTYTASEVGALPASTKIPKHFNIHIDNNGDGTYSVREAPSEIVAANENGDTFSVIAPTPAGAGLETATYDQNYLRITEEGTVTGSFSYNRIVNPDDGTSVFCSVWFDSKADNTFEVEYHSMDTYLPTYDTISELENNVYMALAEKASEQYVKDQINSTVPGWAKESSKPTYTAAEVGADSKGTAATAVSTHNTDTAAHNDLRLELKALADRLTAFFDSDDTTLDELSEIVAYVTNNKTLIDSITTSKVSITDVINNLTTNVANKPLSAAQGVVLNGLIEELSNSLSNYQVKGDYALQSAIPTKVSQLTNDKGYITGYTEKDPTVPAWAKAATKPSYNAGEVGADPAGSANNALADAKSYTDNSVREYGASVKTLGAKGDGVTDDTAAFKTALASERVVFVPGGTYILSDTIVIRQNCCLELSQDAVLKFTQTSKHGINMFRSASLKGNHATIFVPYTFNANVINCDGGDEYAALDPDDINNSNAVAVPPFKKWDPQWKMTRYITDINICKVNSSGFHYSDDGTCYGNAVYVHCNIDDYPLNYMWGINMSGVRIAGGFNHGIRIYNIGAHEECWSHDARIEAVIEACKIGVSLENAYYNRIAATIQPKAALDGTAYAEYGIKIVDSLGTDLSSSRVWDWMKKDKNGKTVNSKWEPDNEYQHIALYGDCRGIILDDFIYYAQSSYDIRDLIYTDTPNNLEYMTILQEPIDRWFKVKADGAFFSDGTNDVKLVSQDEMDIYFDTDLIKNFTDILPEVGYENGYIATNGAFASSDYFKAVGFIPCTKGTKIYVEGMSFKFNSDDCRVVLYKADKTTKIAHINRGNLISNVMSSYVAYEETSNGFVITIANTASVEGVAYMRFSIHNTDLGKYPMISIDNPIEYTVEGFLADGVKVKAENVVGDLPGGDSAVTSVNGKTGEVVLSASDVGALPSTTVIPTVPTKLSEFTNDKGFITSYTETDPTVPAWAKAATKPSYTASEVGLTIETWTFTLANGSTVTKKVAIGS